MKIKLEELKRAVEWIGVNTHAESINISVNTLDGRSVELKCMDKNEREVVINIKDEDVGRFPTVTRTERL